jgi:hypothetical protein
MRLSATGSPFTNRDLLQLDARGIDRSEALSQLERLSDRPPSIELDRPCTPGDGIELLSERQLGALADAHGQAVANGAVSAFVPASGAATRMFRELLVCRRDPRDLTRAEIEPDASRDDDAMRALLEFMNGLDRFAFRHELEHALSARGLARIQRETPMKPVLATLLDADGLGYAARPKGLIPFHDTPAGPRTAFEEHLTEAAELYRDATSRVRMQATVPAEYQDRFLDSVRRKNRPNREVVFDVMLSVQRHSTDTLAVDDSGAPLRAEDGSLVFRPAGHGALLRNLGEQPTPIAMIKNIDNVASDPYREPTRVWARAVIGRLWELRERVHELLRRLDDAASGAAVAEAIALARDAFGRAGPHDDAAPSRDRARALLDRPLRVCAMVPNTGEPGGGPFWVRERDGTLSRQIVEQSQVRTDDSAQRAICESATHFNPVFLACSLDDAHGRRYDLERFVDPAAAIVTRRAVDGRDTFVLERPGLWNGSMAGWNSVFVEAPITIFNPVKTVNDLLRREHQPDRD